MNLFFSSFVDEFEDSRSAENLLDFWNDDKCKILESAHSYHKLPYSKYEKNSLNETIDGLACINNRTLTIIAMDSLSHYQFSEGLGVNIQDVKDKTAVIIMDKQVYLF